MPVRAHVLGCLFYRAAMPATTPPKGRPTAGRRDRTVAQRKARARSNTKRIVWGVLAFALVAAIIVAGSGSGSGTGTDTQTNVVVPFLLLSCRRLRLRP